MKFPPMYGTLAYRMMLAANRAHGYITVWAPPDYVLTWARIR